MDLTVTMLKTKTFVHIYVYISRRMVNYITQKIISYSSI